MKQSLLLAALLAVALSYSGESKAASLESELAAKVVTRYNVAYDLAASIVSVAIKHSDPVFPRPWDILGIISVESRFKPKAASGGNVCLMQVNVSAHKDVSRSKLLSSLDECIGKGTDILREYYGQLKGNPTATIHAYNKGIGSYLSGKRAPEYYSKVVANTRYFYSTNPTKSSSEGSNGNQEASQSDAKGL